MSKRKTELTEKKIAEMEKEGRGQGTGEDYKPWINIQDFRPMDWLLGGKGGKQIASTNFYPNWNVITSMCWNGTTLLSI